MTTAGDATIAELDGGWRSRGTRCRASDRPPRPALEVLSTKKLATSIVVFSPRAARRELRQADAPSVLHTAFWCVSLLVTPLERRAAPRSTEACLLARSGGPQLSHSASDEARQNRSLGLAREWSSRCVISPGTLRCEGNRRCHRRKTNLLRCRTPYQRTLNQRDR